MNWKVLRHSPWIDTRALFVTGVPRGGTLLDIGSSTGETLGHIAELRPDLRLAATDIEGNPERYPAGTAFHRGDILRDRLPLPDASVDAITCMQVVEHLPALGPLVAEAARLLRPGGRIFFETPHPKTIDVPSAPGSGFTLNFHDDPTHVAPVPAEALAAACRNGGLKVIGQGVSRNWLFALSWLLYRWRPGSRRKYTAQVHWLGWSYYLVAERPR